ncbi:MAG TPA: extracellular solute-binding protein [Paracoccaceae bacterium]|nr:extracellular solute-binding protein [Paracoccaceae bacterium]
MSEGFMAGGRRNSGLLALAAAMLAAWTSGAAAQSASEARWAEIVEAAKKEGAVTIYSGQGLLQLKDLAARFEEAYGIPVQVVRAVESELLPKVDAEFTTGQGIADIFVSADIGTVRDRNAKGYIMPAVGPAFDNPDYDRATRMPETTYFECGAAILTFSWNTELHPKGIKDYPDVLDPSLEGKIGVPNPTTMAQVDFYLYLQENYGEDYVEKLAALKPRIYAGALPLAQAVVSGEVAVAVYGQALIDEQAKGAPVDWGLAPKPWGARFWGWVLKSAPHPNAAQLLANFMVTEEGQEAVQRLQASVLPNVEGAIATTDNVRRPDLAKLTPEFASQYRENWRKLFGQQ